MSSSPHSHPDTNATRLEKNRFATIQLINVNFHERLEILKKLKCFHFRSFVLRVASEVLLFAPFKARNQWLINVVDNRSSVWIINCDFQFRRMKERLLIIPSSSLEKLWNLCKFFHVQFQCLEGLRLRSSRALRSTHHRQDGRCVKSTNDKIMSRRSEACFAQLHYGGRALSDGIRSFRYSDLLSTKPPAEDFEGSLGKALQDPHFSGVSSARFISQHCSVVFNFGQCLAVWCIQKGTCDLHLFHFSLAFLLLWQKTVINEIVIPYTKKTFCV